jgi:Fungal specific transcription factor domain
MFMQSFEQDYTRDRPEDLTWWAVVNIVTALSIRLNPNHKELNNKAWEYAQNAFNAIPDLTMKQTDLTAIQALLGMSIFLQGTPNPRPASVLIAAAIRLSYGLGMHRKEFSNGLSPIEADQRQRVFWIAYCLDKYFSLKFEQPPIINDNDMDLDIPEAEPNDELGLIRTTGGNSTINYFRLRINLATIQSKVYTDLYSVHALKLSESERLPLLQRLDNMLVDWKDCLPVGLQPDKLASSVSPPSLIHIVELHMLYFNCLAMVHRVSFQNRNWTKAITGNEDLKALPDQHLCYSALRCAEAARASVHLMSLAPQADFVFTWY